jgi:hypothetical protein
MLSNSVFDESSTKPMIPSWMGTVIPHFAHANLLAELDHRVTAPRALKEGNGITFWLDVTWVRGV